MKSIKCDYYLSLIYHCYLYSFQSSFKAKIKKSQTISEKKNMIRVYLGFCFNLKHILISFQDIN